MFEIFMGVSMFTAVVLAMVVILLVTRHLLVGGGSCGIVINGDDSSKIDVPTGTSLLNALADKKIFISSACGGGGTCGQCKVQITEGGGQILPTETTHVSRGEAAEHWRLSCQVKVKNDMQIQVPEEVFSVKKVECEVISNHNVATFIKEFVLRLPPGESLDFQSGGYIQIDIPPHDINYKDFAVEEEYRDEWDKYDVWRYRSVTDELVVRAYSMANYPAEGDIVMLNVRIATPPPRGPEGIPPGKGSSYIFNCKPGDKVTVSGPYGEFYIKPTKKEMVYIGGGAGMAPMRSHLLHLFRTEATDRKVSFWYGARSLREMFYMEDFDEIQEKFPNFQWHVGLSEPKPEDNWTGYVGFIHQILHDEYLKDHDAPEEIEYYICGPPMMLSACQKMLDSLGVEPENIAYDDFG